MLQAVAPETKPRDDRPVDGAIQPCPLRHWFDLSLKFAPPAEPRPIWWPAERLSGYSGEKLSVTAPGIVPAQQLDGQGRLRIDDIPAGKADVVFRDLLVSVRDALEEGSRYASS
jgi:hypothetical protein